jgi:heme oxygenase
MTTLKELTHDSHVLAEQHKFTQLLLSGKMSESIYSDFLYNQHAIYYTLESVANTRGLLDNLPGLCRADLIKQDLIELNAGVVKLYTSTQEYVQYVANNLTDQQILAHLYVRHMGDLYGGQMIKKLVPGSATMYEFENRKDLIDALRNKLDVSMASEANLCFDYAIELFSELANEHNI